MYLTKHHFINAMHCPTYLSHLKNINVKKESNTILTMLAEGGYQVQELVKLEFPDGILIDKMNHMDAVRETQSLIDNNENVVIFEGAFYHDNCFIRCDIIEKRGNVINLYEVKSSSFDPANFTMRQKRNPNKILVKWLPLLYDVGYQSIILQRALSEYTIISNVIMMDKTSKTSVDGLNQMFKISDNNGKVRVLVDKHLDYGDRIIESTNVDEFIEVVKSLLGDYIGLFLEIMQSDDMRYTSLGIKCKTCVFKDEGRNNCFSNFSPNTNFQELPTIFDIWNYRNVDKNISQNIILMSDLDKKQFVDKDDNFKNKTSERQWLQIERTLKNDLSINNEFIDPRLYTEMSTWSYPLHFIDFETTRVAIPFYSNSHPYELVVFQYSIHTIHKNGTITHHEWLETGNGVYPNIEFIRHLKKDLESDDGSVFCYSQYENTVLNSISKQLEDIDVSDKQQLMEVIDTLTIRKIKNKVVHTGKRVMIDMLKLVKQFYYHPMMRNSNSIKDVLPSILHVSEYIKDKYQKKYVDGSNFGEDMIWFQENQHGVIDPYMLLKVDNKDHINQGYEAMIYYMKLQFLDLDQATRDDYNMQLLRYCELDTLAMLMIFEHWKSCI